MKMIRVELRVECKYYIHVRIRGRYPIRGLQYKLPSSYRYTHPTIPLAHRDDAMSMQGEQLLQAIVNPPGNIIIKSGVMLLVPEAALVLAAMNDHVFRSFHM